MSLYNTPNLTSGIDQALITTSQEVPAFPIMTLVFTFFVVLIGGCVNQKGRTGTLDLPFWAVLSSTTTTLLALVFTLGDGMIDITTLGIVIAVNISCAFWFFVSKQRGEI